MDYFVPGKTNHENFIAKMKIIIQLIKTEQLWMQERRITPPDYAPRKQKNKRSGTTILTDGIMFRTIFILRCLALNFTTNKKIKIARR